MDLNQLVKNLHEGEGTTGNREEKNIFQRISKRNFEYA